MRISLASRSSRTRRHFDFIPLAAMLFGIPLHSRFQQTCVILPKLVSHSTPETKLTSSRIVFVDKITRLNPIESISSFVRVALFAYYPFSKDTSLTRGKTE